MPHEPIAQIYPALELLARDEDYTPEYRISRLLEYANDFTLRIVNLSTLVTRMASQLGAILTKLDASKKLGRTEGVVVNARQLMYSYNKQRDDLYLLPALDDHPEYGLGLVRLLLLAIPVKKGEAGFIERVVAIQAINTLIRALADEEVA